MKFLGKAKIGSNFETQKILLNLHQTHGNALKTLKKVHLFENGQSVCSWKIKNLYELSTTLQTMSIILCQQIKAYGSSKLAYKA